MDYWTGAPCVDRRGLVVALAHILARYACARNIRATSAQGRLRARHTSLVAYTPAHPPSTLHHPYRATPRARVLREPSAVKRAPQPPPTLAKLSTGPLSLFPCVEPATAGSRALHR